MSLSESYDACMQQKGLPLLGDIFSQKSLTEILEVFEEIDQALEGAGGKEITFTALPAAATAAGATLSPATLEVVGVLAGAAADLVAFFYMTSAANCLSLAIVKNALVAELDAAPDGTFKEQVEAQAEGVA
jgi:hypothetical protein